MFLLRRGSYSVHGHAVVSSDRRITQGGEADRGYAAHALDCNKVMASLARGGRSFGLPPEPRSGERGGVRGRGQRLPVNNFHGYGDGECPKG